MSRPARWFRITPAKCDELPAVNDANDTLLPCGLAQATNSAMLLAGMLAAFTANTIAEPRKLVTGLKLFCAS